MKPGCGLSERWKEIPLPIYTLPEDHYAHCDRHGDYATHAYYDEYEIAEMLAEDGKIECPECLSEICYK